MAEQAKGTVDWAGGKKVGSRTYYSFKIGDEFYRTGLNNTKVKQGDYVEFEYEEGEFGNQVEVSTLEISKAKKSVSTEKAASKAGGKVKEDWDSRAKYWENKELLDIERQKIISYQAATNTAVEIIKIALDKELITITGTKNKKLENLQSQIAGVAEDLVVQYMGAPKLLDELMKEGKPAVNTEEQEEDYIDDE